jgi:hypothetical protein
VDNGGLDGRVVGWLLGAGACEPLVRSGSDEP